MKWLIIYTCVVSLLIGFIAGYFFAIGSISMQIKPLMEEIVQSHGSIPVRCFAKKYSWHFHYAGADGKFGDTNLSLITNQNPIGLNLHDPRSKDDIVSTELVLPCDTQVQLITGSADVIHSLGEFHDKMEIDAVPSLEEKGTFQTPGMPASGTLRCVQLCGPGFKDHHAPYRYIDAAAYAKWLKTQIPLSEKIAEALHAQ